MTLSEVWTDAQLMGVKEGAAESPEKPANGKHSKGGEDAALLWGFPGHLTKEEVQVFNKFKVEVEKRGGEFRDTVYSFGEEEGEAWALARWLRARKYVYDDVIKMVEEATEVRKDAKAKQFYPNPMEALGVDTTIYCANYPQLYTGFAKNGVPLYISKPGVLNVDAMECITTLDGIIKFHWHAMMHDFADRLRSQKKKDPNFKRFECLCVLDLNHLTTAQLSSRALAIVKEQAAIDSVCFPETMYKMIIVNAPTFFTATWRIIKGWLDARTANKIEVISSKATMEKRLLELVDADQLPSDYGGTGPDTNYTLMESLNAGEAHRLETKMMYVRGHSSEVLELSENESVDIEVFTRSTAGALFHIVDASTKKEISPHMEVKHVGSEEPLEMPTNKMITIQRIKGPIKLKVKADSHAGRFSRHNYLLVYYFYKK